MKNRETAMKEKINLEEVIIGFLDSVFASLRQLEPDFTTEKNTGATSFTIRIPTDYIKVIDEVLLEIFRTDENRPMPKPSIVANSTMKKASNVLTLLESMAFETDTRTEESNVFAVMRHNPSILILASLTHQFTLRHSDECVIVEFRYLQPYNNIDISKCRTIMFHKATHELNFWDLVYFDSKTAEKLIGYQLGIDIRDETNFALFARLYELVSKAYKVGDELAFAADQTCYLYRHSIHFPARVGNAYKPKWEHDQRGQRWIFRVPDQMEMLEKFLEHDASLVPEGAIL